ncbi:AMP-dependent synthetase and ligase [Vibrio sinaloensis DSM 21326]|uniref:AMP-dependent synthetase and ligase n=1 Tax=Vibrio sinaloensis DSM 21326 TaxID=945550 RepID=E8M578_PHOS4|nr:AMP-binding protein [Vibrio sinaloensis]EGA70929.1 AMP-dependent synthetase and ligase [Vibrio sinaloensis DSM 21326]
MSRFIFPESQSSILTEDGSNYTYSELLALSSEVHQRMLSGSVIICQVANDIGGLLGYFAFAYGEGFHPLMLGQDIHQSHIEAIIEKYEPEYAWVPMSLIPMYGDDASVLCRYFDYCLIQLKSHLRVALKPVNNQLCVLASTSGSTGSPKFVRQSVNNVLSNSKSITEYLSLSSDDTAITSLPLHYTYGMSLINCQIAVGGNISLTDKSFVQKEFWSQLREHDVSVLAGVPYTYEMMDRLRVFRKDLPKITTLMQAGGKLSESLQTKVAEYSLRYGKKFFVMYGQTEATTRMSFLPPDMCLSKIGSIGLAIPGGAFSIVDDDGNECEENQVGELIYHGPNVTLGYAESREDLGKGDDWKGFLSTGDLASRDADGYYYIQGRLKRIVKHFGLRVNLDEVEKILKKRFEKHMLACTEHDEVIKVFVDAPISHNEVLDHLTSTTSLKRSGIEIIELASIPVMSSGKVDYQALKLVD